MEILLVKVVTAVALPPGVNLLGCALGLALRRRARRLARALVVLSLGSLYLLSTGALADRLIEGLEAVAPIADPAALAGRADAIVVLGGGRNGEAPEYGGETVSGQTLVRTRYAALLQRASHLPLLASGGVVYGDGVAEAEMMAHVLVAEFGVSVRWVEPSSRNTAENAIYSQRLLERADARRVALVTHAMHMPRARAMFERVGLEVIPAPTGFHAPSTGNRLFDWLPSASALGASTAAVHEHLGRLWYALRY